MSLAEHLTEDFLTHNPDPGRNACTWTDHAVSLRTSYLVCLWDETKAEWLVPAISEHAAALADPHRYAGPWNHGTMQNIALLAAAQMLDDATLRRTAVQRLRAQADLAVDDQGAPGEQATGYAPFIWQLWETVAAQFDKIGVEPPAGLRARLDAMDRFVAHSTSPDGHITPIGDSWPDPPDPRVGPRATFAATHGSSGTKPGDVRAVYRRGYVFARDSWTDPRYYYTIRFGPGRDAHGHVDHLSITYWASGRHVLIDPGYAGYANRDYRAWSVSPDAHNVAVVTGAAPVEQAAARLIRATETERGWAYQLMDRAYPGTERRRAVLVDDELPALLVRDDVRTEAAQQVSILWHLDPSWRLERVVNTTAMSQATFLSPDGRTRAWVVQPAAPGEHLPPETMSAHRGERDPYRGWVSWGLGEMTPAWALESHRSGSAHVLTAVVTAPVGDDVELTRSDAPGESTPGESGSEVVTLRVGSQVHTFTSSEQEGFAVARPK